MLILFFTSFILLRFIKINKKEFILGANLIRVKYEEEDKAAMAVELDMEKYFRPSKLSILNNSIEANNLINNYFNNSNKNINIPKNYLKSPEDTIVNYFSILREAANPVKGKYTGCGSLGMGKIPYKIAYEFFLEQYKEKNSFNNYEDSFKNILHINLLKFKEVPIDSDNENIIRYFYEIETIEGSENGVGNFSYYYGYLLLSKVNDEYKILDINITPEVYLCAPYHGWQYNAEYSVSIRYGDWCNLIKSVESIEVNDYVKEIYFKGNDDKEYKIQFYILTNDYDIEVAQFVKNNNGQWKNIKINPENCLKNNNKN